MSGAHWHLVVNHLPIIFPIVAVIVLVTGLRLVLGLISVAGFLTSRLEKLI